MKLAIVTLLLSLAVWAADGDVLAVRVLGTTCAANAGLANACDGWVAEVDLSNVGGTMATGRSYAFGLDANNRPATPTAKFTVASSGFDNSAGAITVRRTVYAQYPLRKPYPNNAVQDETCASSCAAGNTLTVRVVLSSPIFSSDTATADFLAGFYTGSNAAVAVSVTNGSGLAYQKPVCNWDGANPSRRLASGTLTLSAFGLSGMAANGQPLAAMTFYASDAHSHTSTATVSTLSRTSGMAVDFFHYVATLDISAFTVGDVITANFKAYPRVGSATEVFDTNDNTAAGENTFKAAPLFWVVGTNATFGQSLSFVEPTGAATPAGNDTTCVASETLSVAQASPCLTIGRAERVIRDYNNAHFSRQNLANSIIYLQAGTYPSVQAVSLTYNASGDTVVWTLTRAPGVAQASVIMQTDATSTNRFLRGQYVRVTGITIARDANRNVFNANENIAVFLDNCVINDSTAYTVPILSTNFGRISYFQNSWNSVGTPGGYWFVGNTVTTSVGLTYARTILGNLVTAAGTTHGGAILNESSSCVTAASDGAVVYNNKFFNTQDEIIALSSTCNVAIGLVIANNLFESNYVTGSGPAVAISADGTTTTTNNVVIAHNTIIGNRSNLAYNDSGTVGTLHTNWVVKNNIFEYFANKQDLFTPSNGNRVGGWRLAFGVSTQGNFGKRGAFTQEFVGLLSKTGIDASPIDPHFVSDQSQGGSGSGNGDYHLLSNSPAAQRKMTCMLPYDIEGIPCNNSGYGSAGAYEQARLLTPVFF